MKSFALPFVSLLLLACVACTEINIDEHSTLLPRDGGGVGIGSFQPLGQTFTPVVPNPKWIGIDISNCSIPVDFRMTLRRGSGTDGKVLAVRTATAAPEYHGFIYFNVSGLPLVVGSQYTALFEQLTVTPECTGDSVETVDADVYPGENAIVSGQPAAYDLLFRVLTAVYDATPRPPLNADGTSVFAAGTVVPVTFALTADGRRTCNLPRAEIEIVSLPRPPTVVLQAEAKIRNCEYTLDVPTQSFSGLYRAYLLLPNSKPFPLAAGDVFFSVNTN